jgi:hypothetical protein
MMHRALTLAILIAASTASWGQAPSTTLPGFVEPLRPLLEAMDRAKVSGSLALLGRCDASTPPDFPKFHAPSAAARTPLEIARETFADDPAMRVWQDPDGTVRMMEMGVPTELLNVKISHILFESNETAIEAIRHVILRTPEVVNFMKAHEIEIPLVEGISRGPGPSARRDESHRISGSLDDVTLSQALDEVLKTFPGIWVYESCPQDDGKGQFVDFLFLDHQHPGLFEEPRKNVR